MSNEIEVGYSLDFTTSVEMLLQAEGGKLYEAVTHGSYVGESGEVVHQLGKARAQKRTSRHADTPLIETPHDARWVNPQDYEWADMIDKADRLKTLIDPTNPYVQVGVNALRRAQDDEVLGAFRAAAKTGNKGATSTAYDTNMDVGVSVGGTNSGLNVAKLREAKKLLRAKHVNIEMEDLYLILNAEAEQDLLAETQVVSTDFNDRPVLVDGNLVQFLGFKFIHMELQDDGTYESAESAAFGSGTSGDPRLLPFWVRSGMHCGTWNGIEARVSERPDKSYSWQAYVSGSFGATRTEEGKVGAISITE